MNAKSKVRILQYENYILITNIFFDISNILNDIVNVTKYFRTVQIMQYLVFLYSLIKQLLKTKYFYVGQKLSPIIFLKIYTQEGVANKVCALSLYQRWSITRKYLYVI